MGTQTVTPSTNPPSSPPTYSQNNESYVEEMELHHQHEADMSFAKGVMTVVYLAVFLVGTPGNIWIIYKLFRARLWSSTNIQMTVSQRSRIYIFALACSDLMLLMTLPPTASYNYHGAWIFGSLACYAVRSCEIFAKLFSVILLAVMSLERYIIVCTRFRHVYRVWMSLLPLAFGTVFGVIGPTLFHLLYLKHFPVYELLYPNETESAGLSQEEMNTMLCLPTMNNAVFDAFAQYTFVVGFIIPFVIMTICYILLVRHVRLKYQNRKAQASSSTSTSTGKEPRYMTEVRKSIWRIAVFHFVCWAPFWAFTMTPHYIELLFTQGGDDGSKSISFVYSRLVFNCLPYINAAGNWVLYALLNYDVRKHIYSQPKKKRKFMLKFHPVAMTSV